MTDNSLKKKWNNIFAKAPKTLDKMAKINRIASAFNTCIDSVVKISGEELFKLIKSEKLSLKELTEIKHKSIDSASDLLKGVFNCFRYGIAEEWTAEDKSVFDWMLNNLGTKKMQIGGQAGIIANTMSLTGIKQVIVHSNALSDLQASQFFKRNNLLSFDKDGKLNPAFSINRDSNTSIHWIVEFDKNDKITLDGKDFICPKSNRFIATYDPPLFDFVIDENFMKYTNSNKVDYFVLSGYQALSSHNHGVKHVKDSIAIVKSWKKASPKSIVHLEIASTQDTKVRHAVAKYLAPYADSIGVNERETMDILEVINQKKLLETCRKEPSAVNLFKAIMAIKNKLKYPRIQLHMFGLYITIQNKNFPIKPLANRNGMVLAATAAASKAYVGKLSETSDILEAYGQPVSDIGLSELEKLSNYLKQPDLLSKGIACHKDFDIITVPTILIEKPKTLVGMGDTISAFSIVGAR